MNSPFDYTSLFEPNNNGKINYRCDFFCDKLPKNQIIIDHIDSDWSEKVTNFLLKSDYDYVETTNIEIGSRCCWTIPQKIKIYERNVKLDQLLNSE